MTALETALRRLIGIVPPTPSDYAALGADAFKAWELDLIDAQNQAREALNLTALADDRA